MGFGFDWIGLASQAVGGWAVGVPDSWDPAMGCGLQQHSSAAQRSSMQASATQVCSKFYCMPRF